MISARGRVLLAVTAVALIVWPCNTTAWRAGAAALAGMLAVGWWTEDPAATAPPGGLVVGQAAGRPVSVAALRIAAPDLDGVSITFSGTGGWAQDHAQVVGCLTTAPWRASQGGSLDDAPAVSCDRTRSAPLRAAAPGVWRIELRDLVKDTSRRELSVALVPATVLSLAELVPWELQVGPPALAPLDVARERSGTPPEQAPLPPAAKPVDQQSLPPLAAGGWSGVTDGSQVTSSTPRLLPDPTVHPPPGRLAVDSSSNDTQRPLGRAALFVLLALVAGSAGGLVHLRWRGTADATT